MLIVLGLGLIISAFIAFKNLNDYISTNYDGATKTVLSSVVGVANGAVIFVFAEIYKIASIKVNDFQNHKYQSSYENSYIFKRAFFDFVLSYINLTFYAFYLQDFALLANNFITIIISKNLLFAFKVR